MKKIEKRNKRKKFFYKLKNLKKKKIDCIKFVQKRFVQKWATPKRARANKTGRAKVVVPNRHASNRNAIMPVF